MRHMKAAAGERGQLLEIQQGLKPQGQIGFHAHLEFIRSFCQGLDMLLEHTLIQLLLIASQSTGVTACVSITLLIFKLLSAGGGC